MLYGMQLVSYQGIKKKARIMVNDSATLIGCVDTDGWLEEGQVFVQIRRDSYKCKKKLGDSGFKKAQVEHVLIDEQVLLGNLMVTRNPATHPGDVRVMTGVDVPQLRHLTNVVVFSSKGERPACNMMAGGDLDGDVYFVCWDKELLTHFKSENVEEAQAY